MEGIVQERPLVGQSRLRKIQGVWVWRAGKLLTEAMVKKTVRAVRREREAEVLGIHRK